MEGFSIFILILSIVWSVLSIVLFFKVWEMTNDVREIKNKILYDVTPQKEVLTPVIDNREIKEGDTVIEKATGNEIFVKSVLANGKYICWRDKNKTYMEKYFSSEIETLEEYAKHNNK